MHPGAQALPLPRGPVPVGLRPVLGMHLVVCGRGVPWRDPESRVEAATPTPSDPPLALRDAPTLTAQPYQHRDLGPASRGRDCRAAEARPSEYIIAECPGCPSTGSVGS